MDVAVQIQKKRSKFLGVRQRPSGKWVAEIKNTTKKIRMWLGTFTTAEEAARAYDEAACLLRGSNTRTNFGPNHRLSHNSPLSLKIRNLLHLKHTQQKHSLPLPTITNTAPLPLPPQSTIQVPFIYNWNAPSPPSDAQIQIFDDAYRPDLSDCQLGFDQLPFTYNHYHHQETETNAGFQSGFGEVHQVTELEIERAPSSHSYSYSYLDNAYLFSQTW